MLGGKPIAHAGFDKVRNPLAAEKRKYNSEPFPGSEPLTGVNGLINIRPKNRMNYILMFSALLAAATSSLQAASPYRTDVNPALLYWQAFHFLPERSPAEEKIFDQRRTAVLDHSYEALSARYDTVFRFVRRATDLKSTADWGIDFADGPEALLPHLAKAKAVAQAAQFRARLHLEHGRENEAIQDLVGALVLGRQLSKDGTLISKLVQIAIDNIVVSSVAENYHAFSTEGLKKLMAEFDASPAGNSVSNCIGIGERLFVDWYRRQLAAIHAKHPGDEAGIMREIRDLLARTVTDGSDTEKNYAKADELIAAAGGTSRGMLALIEGMNPLYDEMQSIAALPLAKFEDANQAFFERMETSTNLFAKEFFPALKKARGKELRDEARRQMLRAAVQFRLHGEAGFKTVNDPLGAGPFAYRRFTFQNVDRGFELRSNYPGEQPEVIIFVEKDGAPFNITGPNAGKALTRK